MIVQSGGVTFSPTFCNVWLVESQGEGGLLWIQIQMVSTSARKHMLNKLCNITDSMRSVGEIVAFLNNLSHQHHQESDTSLVTFHFWAGSAGWIPLCAVYLNMGEMIHAKPQPVMYVRRNKHISSKCKLFFEKWAFFYFLHSVAVSVHKNPKDLCKLMHVLYISI